MKLFDYQTYFIATDANHVTQHRRVVTPWFVKKLKSIRYMKFKFYDTDNGAWAYINDNDYDFLSSKNFSIKNETLNKLEMVTMVFNEGDL